MNYTTNPSATVHSRQNAFCVQPGAEAACLFLGTPGVRHAKRFADKGVANEGWNPKNRQPRSDRLLSAPRRTCDSVTHAALGSCGIICGMKTNVVVAIIALVVGAVLGWAIKPAAPLTTDADNEKPSARRARIAESKSRVKTVTTVVTNTVRDTVTNTVEVVREPPRGPEGWRAEMERLKEENPTEYAARTNRMAQFRARMLQNAENKLETLASIDTTGWTPQQIETHQRYQELIAKREELMDSMRFDSDATEEQRRAAREQMWELGREIHKASQEERNLLLNKAIREMGFKGAAAAEVKDTITTIYSATQEWGGPRGGRGGPPPPRR